MLFICGASSVEIIRDTNMLSILHCSARSHKGRAEEPRFEADTFLRLFPLEPTTSHRTTLFESHFSEVTHSFVITYRSVNIVHMPSNKLFLSGPKRCVFQKKLSPTPPTDSLSALNFAVGWRSCSCGFQPMLR